MFTDTHCHLNIMVKKAFDKTLIASEIEAAHTFIQEAKENDVTKIINVGTSLIESQNCLALAHRYPPVYASIGIHPNDATADWQKDFSTLKKMVRDTPDKIVAIGECGIDFHYPDFNKDRQRAVFTAHIELALEHNLALIVHSRDAADETLACLDRYAKDGLRGTIHCFSYDMSFAQEACARGFVLGIGGTITYPKNELLRTVVKEIGIEQMILETDAPFLPPQIIRGQQNHPKYTRAIAEYVATLRALPLDTLAHNVNETVQRIFGI